MVFTRTRGRFSRCILGRCGFPLLLFLSALLAPSAAAGEEGGWKPYFEDTFARTSPGPDWLAIEEDGRGLRLDGKSACLTFSHSTRYPYRESLPQRCATLLPLHERGQATCPGDAKEHRASGREQQGPRLHSAIGTGSGFPLSKSRFPLRASPAALENSPIAEVDRFYSPATSASSKSANAGAEGEIASGMDSASGPETAIRLPQAAHVYEALSGTEFGETDLIETGFAAGEPKVFALCPL